MNLSHILASFHAAALDMLIAHARLADEALAEYKYSPNQPRVPAGSPEGGQWTDGGGGASRPAESTPNMDKAIEHLRENAHAKPQGQCAAYVRRALNAGGFKVKPPGTIHGYAKEYGSSLERAGFKPIVTVTRNGRATVYPPLGYIARVGDVAITDTYPSAKTPAGHMTMYDGRHWISDFRQRGFWGGTGYHDYGPSYTIYRYGL